MLLSLKNGSANSDYLFIPYMHSRLFLPGLMILFNHCYSQPEVMFRGNAAHDSYVSTSESLIYDSKAWRFDAGAPVRSSPLVSNSSVYFGTAAGDFFAV